MKLVFLLFLGLSLLSCEIKPSKNNFISIDVSAEMVHPKHYLIAKNTTPLLIDGFANESSWQRALYSDSFIDIEGVLQPKYDTKMKMLWDENFLYVFAEMEEPHIWGDLKQRDTVIFYNNDFEVFIAPSGTTRNYGEIEINSLGTVWDLLLDKPYRDHGKANNHWNLNELKSAVQIYGTLNDHTDIDSLWTVEMAIPMSALVELKNAPKSIPKEGEQWRINFSRVQWDFDVSKGYYQRKKANDGTYKSEYNWVWSNQNVINMHEPEKWGYLQFTEDTTAVQKTFRQDQNNRLEQVCFALFRQAKYGELKPLLQTSPGTSQSIRVTYSGADSLEATFYRTLFGFEFKIPVPESNQVYIINESGSLQQR